MLNTPVKGALRAMSTRTSRTSRRTAVIAATTALLAVPGVAFGASLSGPAGGDLTGSYPNPQIAGNAITHDTSVLNSAFGNFSSKIGDAAVGSSEIAKGQVQADELGTIAVRTSQETIPPAMTASVTAQCAPGERLLSGGGGWTGMTWSPDQYVIVTRPATAGDGWDVRGANASSTKANTLQAYALCLG